jgi:hypothetical protein
MGTRVRLTTVDNPYNPFTEFFKWFDYDTKAGYNTCNRIASITYTSPGLTDAEVNELAEATMDDIIKTGAFGKNGDRIEYKKVYYDK